MFINFKQHMESKVPNKLIDTGGLEILGFPVLDFIQQLCTLPGPIGRKKSEQHDYKNSLQKLFR